MKRSGPPPRYTRLARSAMPPRSTPLRRSTSRLGLRRPKKTPAEKDARDLVYERSEGVCEACGEHEAVHWHHRINKGQGGPWSAANGMHVCVFCHAWIGDFPASAGVLGWHLEPWQDRAGVLARDPALEPLRYRGQWVVLGDDGAITPTHPPERAAELLRVAEEIVDELGDCRLSTREVPGG